MTVTIYHHPRCSKSRQTLALLEAKGVAPRIVDYLKTPPSAAELKTILNKLGIGPRDLVRKGEPRYAEFGLKDRKVDAAALIAARPLKHSLSWPGAVTAIHEFLGPARRGCPAQGRHDDGRKSFRPQASRLGLTSIRSPRAPRPSILNRRAMNQTGKTMTAPSRK